MFPVDIGYTRTENPRVGGSIPPLGTIIFKDLPKLRKSAICFG